MPALEHRSESGFADSLNIAGGMPPAFRNHLVPIACGKPTLIAAFSFVMPAAIAARNRRRSSRPATGGRPGDNNRGCPDRCERGFRMCIATSFVKVLRQTLKSAQPSVTYLRNMGNKSVIELTKH